MANTCWRRKEFVTTTAYHPQTDGATEQVNQEIEAYLSIYCSAHPTEWKNSLSTLEFTHNNQRHADWAHTSFELIHGEAPLVILTSFENTKFPSVAEKIKNLVTSQEEALVAHELARSQMAEQIKLNFTPFKRGQMVWLDTKHLKTNYHKKMAPKWEGPFKIEEVLVSGDTQFHMTIGHVSKRFNPRTHAVMRPLSQVTIGRTLKPLDPRLFSVTMALSQVTIGHTSKPFDPRVPIFPLIIVQPLLVR